MKRSRNISKAERTRRLMIKRQKESQAVAALATITEIVRKRKSKVKTLYKHDMSFNDPCKAKTSDKVPGGMNNTKRSVMDERTLQGEKKSTVAAIKAKAANVAPAYNKGGLAYEPNSKERPSKNQTAEHYWE